MIVARLRRSALAIAFALVFGTAALAQTGPPPVLSDAKGFFNYQGATGPDAAAITAGAFDFTLVITGTGLTTGSIVPGSSIVWIPSGATCPTGCTYFSNTVVGNNQAKVDIPYLLFTNPDPGNRVAVSNYPYTSLSNLLPFPVNPTHQRVSTVPGGTVGVNYSAPLVTGGTPPYTYSFEVGGFPPGLTGTPAGAMAGVPTTAGVYTVDLYIFDAWLSVYAPFTVTIAPAVSISFTPSTLPGGTVGQSYSQTLTGTGGTAPYSFTVASGSPPGGLNLAANGTVSGTPAAAGTSTFLVRVTDAQSATATAPVTIAIAPTFTPATLPNGQVGLAYSQALSGSGGTAPYAFTVTGGALPGGLNLASNGAITGTPGAQGTFTFQVQVQDLAQNVGTQSRSITIGPTPSFTPTTLPGGQVGTAYSQSLAGTNGTAPYTFAVASGSLPPGVTLSSSGVFSGVPTAAGDYNFQVQVQDANLAVGGAPLSITVAPATVPLGFTPTTLPNGQAGVPYSQTLSGAGGTAPYTFNVTAGSPPPGVTLAANGILSGTPAGTGTFNFTVRVVDATDATASNALTLTIGASQVPLGFTPTTIPPGQTGTVFSRSFLGTGGTAPYTFTLNAGTLPAGLTLSSSGTLSGVPQQSGAFVANILVRDSQGATGFVNLTVVILAALQIVNPSLPQAVPLQAYGAQLLAIGGQPPYVWTLTGGALPGGLVLNGASGIISGTSDGQSGGAFVVTVRDSLGATAVRSFDIALVVQPPVLQAAELPPGTVGSPYSHKLAGSGGTGALQFAVSGGSFPAGLTLSPAGDLTGTPTAAGDYTFGVRVTDSLGRSATGTVHLPIRPPALQITTGALPVTQGGAVAIQFAATGGTPPYTWSVASGTLPPGLSLSPAGLLGGRTDTPGTFDFRLLATDARGSTAARAYSLQLTPAALRVATTSLPGGRIAAAYSASLAAEGGVPPYQWTVTGLPPGLTVAAATGAIEGAPTQDGAFRATARVSDSRGQSASAEFDLAVAPPPLVLAARPLPAATAGAAYSASFAASGGVPPYNWLVSAGSVPGLVLSGGGALSGIPTAAGTYGLTVVVSDARGTTERGDFTLTVQIRPLAITTASLPGGVAGQRYLQTLAAAGGVPPYTWSGSVPAGLAIDPSTGTVSGTPAASGPASISAAVRDSAGALATATFQAAFTLPALPPVGIAGPPDTAEPMRQSAIRLSLGTAFPVGVTGVLTLTFRGDSGADDSTVQFSSGGRTAPFTIPANSTEGVFTTPGLGVQTGTVAGTVTLTARLLADGGDLTPNPPPTRQIRIPAGPPVITSVRAVRNAAGFEVQVTGYSSTRELTQASFRFTAAGSPLGTGDTTLPVDAVFSAWYASAASTAFGSQFTFTQPFLVQGSSAAIQSVTVTLTNRQGASAAATANVQ